MRSHSRVPQRASCWWPGPGADEVLRNNREHERDADATWLI